MPRNPKVEFDTLQLYFREPYHINLDNVPGEIVIYQPTIGDIVRIGENRFYETLSIFTTNTTQYKTFLWNMNPRIDWNTFTDFQLFVMLYHSADPEIVKLLFGELDLFKFKPYMRTKDGSPPPEDSDFNNLGDDLEIVLWNDEDTGLQSVISACVNHPGFKYKLQELRDVGVFEFYDSVNRLQIYEHSVAIMRGMYSGFVDGSKLNPEDYNFMRDIIRDTNNSVHKKLKDNG